MHYSGNAWPSGPAGTCGRGGRRWWHGVYLGGGHVYYMSNSGEFLIAQKSVVLWVVSAVSHFVPKIAK